MHKILATEGIVLAKRGAGEANTLVAILTQDLGLVRGSARSARVEQSKLRYGLETLTRGKFSLVRGRYEWKLVGAEHLSREYMAVSPLRRRALGRISRLLLRLIHGEDAVEGLYQTVEEGLACLSRAHTEADAEGIECVLVLRILAHLGYLPRTPAITPFIETDFFSLELAAAATRSRTLLIRTINESLSATGL